MLNTKSFLAVDFGAGSLKLGEFEANESGGLRLLQFAIKPLGPEGAQESTREATVLKALQEVIADKGIASKTVNVCAPGFHVFSKFLKLPPVDAGKVTQIIQYEAQQNVPFPLAEVVWDYQILGTTAGGELEVLLVAIKSDIVEGLFRVAESAKLKLSLADVSPAALCNSFRYNYADLDDCTMLLDIGAKTSNLLFFEKGKVFSRSINLGANSITQDFVTESKLKFEVAEKIKREEGFVSLGGAYEEPENPNQAAISKIARQFMTRLHIQVNQTMQFYRGQQGGSAPQRLFLSGGGSIMGYTPQFFAEKLSIPVEYFNPFRNIQIDPSVNLEELSPVAHSLGEVVGLALRNLAQCPVELNLIPESTQRLQSFNEKKPYLMATVFSLALVVAAMGYLFQQLADVKSDELNSKVKPELEPAQRREAQFKKTYAELKAAGKELGQLSQWAEDRYYWPSVMSELRRILIRTEQVSQQKLRADTGVWIEKFITATPSDSGVAGSNPYMPGLAAPAAPSVGSDLARIREEMRRRYMHPGGVTPPSSITGGAPEPGAAPAPASEGTPASVVNSNEVSTITLTCRAIDLSSQIPDANQTIIYTLQSELKGSTNWFDADKTELDGQIVQDPNTSTFTFGVKVVLKRPLKL